MNHSSLIATINLFRQARDPIHKAIYRKALIQREPFVTIAGTTDQFHQILTLMDKFNQRKLQVIQTSFGFEIVFRFAGYSKEGNTV